MSMNCNSLNSTKKIPKNKLTLYKNGKPYGVGDISYVIELINDYVDDCDMYGHSEVEFTIKKRGADKKW